MCLNSNALDRYRLEGVERVGGSSEQHARDLGVPMQFLDILLPLMNKEQLGWDLWVGGVCRLNDWRFILVLLDG